MGVQGLWELVAPVGRRVSVETLAGKKLAIDASIWMVQFMKAMRDERGEMVRNAHILGFFRRILKLLFLRTKPVFVFDGGTPALKRRTVAARRRHRENAQAKIRKTAEKLLLNHLKAKRLEELAQEIKNGNNSKDKGKQVLAEKERDNKSDDRAAQEAMDEMLAASLAAEEEEELNSNKKAATSQGQNGDEYDEEEEDEEMIIPVTSNIDPSVLASLPPSMQLDLLVQMRERSMAENRQKYQKLKKTPAKFSELQIQSYLKTVAFRREIDQVQKFAAGRGLEGVHSSRIASEANREFIFSSSFTGDKQALSAKAAEKTGDPNNQSMKNTFNIDSVKRSLFTSQPQSPASSINKVTNDFGNEVETYRDESGRLRVSRLRGLGIRMTRDLQRNLDLMKEFEEDFIRGDIHRDPPTKEVSSVEGITGVNKTHNASVINKENNRISRRKTETITQKGNKSSDELAVPDGKSTIEISFIEDDDVMKDANDDLFLDLVSGPSTATLLSASIYPGRSKNESDSEFDWEDGVVDEKDESWQNGQNKEEKQSLAGENNCEEVEVEWEEGDNDVVCPKGESFSRCEEAEEGFEKAVSRGMLEEEADVQEATRRSLQDIQNFTFDKNSETPQLSPVMHPEMFSLPCTTVEEQNVQKNITDNFNRQTVVTEESVVQHTLSSERDDNLDRVLEINAEDEGYKHPVNHEEQQCMNTSEQAGLGISCPRKSEEDFAGNSSKFNSKTVDNALDNIPANSYGPQTQPCDSSFSLTRKGGIDHSNPCSLLEEKVVDDETLQEGLMENNSGSIHTATITSQQDIVSHNVVSEANVEEEISLLRQERLILGDEQRKLERNAESVSSEMFAECQELLQMFGLPYIIAPMEAEAQCAYMEMSNLVDGVVTDDSDVFLFGARSVYKNIFDERKYVETYLMKDIENELGLNRETLIRMALLLGSDYTEGVSGIGIVNAIEVVHAFHEDDGLKKFREWVESPDPSILGKLDSPAGSHFKKKSVKSSNKNGGENSDDANKSLSEDNVSRVHEDQPSADDNYQIKETFMTKHRNVSKNWHLPSSFPSESVITAYTSPQIDNSTEPFIWGKPDIFILRKLCWERFGWDNKKADELLVPVLKEYDKHQTQLRLEAFYTFNERFAKVRSQRIKKALKGITGKGSSEVVLDDDIGHAASTSHNKNKRESEEVKENNTRKDSSKKKRQKTESQNMQSENRFDVTSNLRGRRRGRGRGRGKKNEMSDNSTEEDDGNDCGIKSVTDNQTTKTMGTLRRSTRRRINVKYTEVEKNIDADMDHECNDMARQQDPVEHGSNINAEVETDNKGDISLSGGGFCMDESEGQQGDDALPPATTSPLDDGAINPLDYMLNGGGFCVEDSETEVNTTHIDDSSSKVNREFDGQTIKEPIEGYSKTIKQVDSLYLQEDKEKGETDLGLRAMPFLRKRRKKL